MSSPSPSPKPTRWSSRMGGALRRTSTLLSIARPTTPSNGGGSDRDSDTTSLRRSTSRPDVSTPPAVLSPPARVQATAPSPIAESPAREAEATRLEALRPSPLAQQTTAEAAQPAPEAVATASPEPIQAVPAATAEEATSPAGYVPPPVVDSSVGNPGAFTDEPEELPQAEVVLDPYAAPAAAVVVETAPVEAKVEPEPEAEAEAPAAAAQPVEAPVLVQSASYFDKPMVESMKSSESIIANVPSEFAEAVSQNTTIAAPAQAEEEEHPAPAPAPAPAAQEPDYEHGEAASYYRGDQYMPIAEPHRVAEPESEHEDHAEQQQNPATEGAAAPAPMPAPFSTAVMPSYDLPVYSNQEVWGGVSHAHEQKPHDVWATSAVPQHQEQEHRAYEGMLPIPIPIPVPVGGGASATGNGHASYHHSPASSIRMPNPHTEMHDGDPFADPIAPIIAVTHSDAPHMPHPDLSEQQHRQEAAETHEDAHGAIVMPLPAFNEVVTSRTSHRVPSRSSFGGSRVNLETDETLPLLSRPDTPSKKGNTYLNTSYTHGGGSTTSAQPYVLVSPLAGSSSPWNPQSGGGSTTPPRLHDLGWLEYHLPDGMVYYVHPTRRVTTDVNLRSEKVLGAVTAWLEERKDESVGVGVEGWLREVSGKDAKDAKKGAAGSAGKGGWAKKKAGKGEDSVVSLERYWVDHHVRSVAKEDEEERRMAGYGRNHAYSNGHGYGKGKKQAGAAGQAAKNDEDQLDMEYRYWSFMEAHPAHTALPHKARGEALDVLTWAWTDRLLPPQRAIPAPFSQEECQELINLLRSFSGDNNQDDNGIQTRIVSRILLRVAHWRQTYFRPNKPLPKDVGSNAGHLPVQRRPFRRAVFDILISCLCLGIPYLFVERARLATRATDEESGFLRGGAASPMLIIGACTCLVAAIVLSASVTFLSLPGLDSVARTAGMVAVLFAAGAIAATGVAVLRHKADMERPVPRVGVEGLMVITRRTMALSLPTIFLAYSLIAFISGIVLYTYRGVSLTDPKLTRNSFEDYTRWTVVGVVGALAGMITTSMLLLRR